MLFVKYSLDKINNESYCTLNPQEMLWEPIKIDSSNEVSF